MPKRFGAKRQKTKTKTTFLPGRDRKANSPQWIQLSSRLKSRRSCRLNELLRLRRSLHCRDGRLSTGNGLGNFVKISGADKALVPHRRITLVRALEFFFLEPRICRHSFSRVAMRKFKHAVIQRVETSQRNELELISHGGQLSLEFRDSGFIQLLLPVERR